MCNPALGIMGAQSLGVGMSTVGSYFAAQQQKRSLQHQAKLAEINATISDAAARNTIQAGVIEESRVKLAGAQAKASQRAQIASSGIDLGSTTAVARMTGTDVITEVDASMIRSNALRAAWGQRIDAGNQRRGAASLRASASSISPWMQGATSLITGAGQVASSWYTMNKQGAFEGNTGAGAPSATITGATGAGVYDGGMPWPETWWEQQQRGRS